MDDFVEGKNPDQNAYIISSPCRNFQQIFLLMLIR